MITVAPTDTLKSNLKTMIFIRKANTEIMILK